MPIERGPSQGRDIPFGQRMRQLGRDAFALGWRSAAAIGLTSGLSTDNPVNQVGAGVVAGVSNRVFRELEYRGAVDGEQRELVLLRDLESVLVAVNTIAFPLLLNAQIGSTNKLIATIGGIGVELLLLYGAREPAAHRRELGG